MARYQEKIKEAYLLIIGERKRAPKIDALNNNREPLVTGEDGKKALEMVLAIYKSAAKGGPVRLPLQSCSTLDFKGRFDNE